VLLLLDIGNSQTVAALCDPQSESFLLTWHFVTDRSLTAGEWLSQFSAQAHVDNVDTSKISDVAIASVVPAVSNEIQVMFKSWVGRDPFYVSADLHLGIDLAIDRPQELGADRLCNAVAAHDLSQIEAIVVDVGTATKVEAITIDGVFLGGAIAPGIGVSLEALISRAAQLSSVQLKFPDSPIGKNTIAAMQSGLVLGHVAMIEGLIERFEKELGAKSEVFLTGGFGLLFWQKSKVFTRFEPDLTLRGLLKIWKLNQ
jgi:type III pantothenate kinase